MIFYLKDKKDKEKFLDIKLFSTLGKNGNQDKARRLLIKLKSPYIGLINT